MSAKDIRLIVITCAVASMAVPSRAQDEGPGPACPALRDAVERAVPGSVGNAEAMRRQLSPAVGPQLGARFRPGAVETFAADSLRPDGRCGLRRGNPTWKCTYSNRDRSSLRIDLGRGRVIYTNLLRSEALVPTEVPEGAALDVARRAAAAFGVPAAEIVNPSPRVRHMEVATRPTEGSGGESFKAEAHVWFKRAIGGVPVAFSKFHAALDARGQIARAHVRWPDFRLEPGLSTEDILGRREVVNNVVNHLESELICGSFAEVKAEVA